MTQRGWISVLLISCCACIARAGEWSESAFEIRSPEGLRAWFVLSTRMVLDDADLPVTGTPVEAEIRVGRGESECAQLVVLTARGIDRTSVEFSEFCREGAGEKLEPGRFRANLVGSVPGKVAQKPAGSIKPWHTESFVSSAKTIPDALLKDAIFDLPTGYSRVWVTVRVPKDQAVGLYRGSVKLKRGDEVVIEAPLSVRVWKFVMPDELSVNVMADVNPPVEGAAWEKVKPFYDDLKSHRVNCAGEIFPLGTWRREAPPPDTAEYEKALKYVLDDLGFKRFRFPGGEIGRDETWNGVRVFEEPEAVADVTWIGGGEFVESDPPVRAEETARGGADALPRRDARWTRVRAEEAQLSSARLEGTVEKTLPWVQYSFESKEDEQLWVWLQVDAQQAQERKIVSVDGKEIGTVTGQQSLEDALRFVRLDTPVTATKGKHEIRVAAEGNVGAADAICAVVLTNDPQTDMEQVVRRRSAVSPAFREAFNYHAKEGSDWLRKHGWMKKAQLKLAEAPSAAEMGRMLVVYDFAGEVLPPVRRELAAAPSVALRKSVEVWTPSFRAGSIEEWNEHLEMGDEVWVSDSVLRTLGYPAVGVRVLPWVLGAAGVENYQVGVVNYWPGDVWKETAQRGVNMRQTLVYPDPRGEGIVDSVRWELLREGLEDCEMLRMLREAVDAASASKDLSDVQRRGMEEGRTIFEEELPKLIRGMNDFSWDAAEVERVRKRAGEALSALTP